MRTCVREWVSEPFFASSTTPAFDARPLFCFFAQLDENGHGLRAGSEAGRRVEVGDGNGPRFRGMEMVLGWEDDSGPAIAYTADPRCGL